MREPQPVRSRHVRGTVGEMKNAPSGVGAFVGDAGLEPTTSSV